MRSNSIFALERSLSLSPLKVDRASGTIFNVKIIGFDSENNRKYLPSALKEAKGLYENVKVNIDHPKDDPTDARSAYDRFGKLINIRYVEGKGLFGDLVYLKSHPMASRIIEAAERMPEAFGLSHNAQGEGEKEGDIFVVNKVTEVRHVDLVADPATTKSLSEDGRQPKKKAWKSSSSVAKFQTQRSSKMAKKWLEADDDKKPMEDYAAPDEEKDTKEDDSESGNDDLASKVMDALKEADTSDEDKAQKIVDLVKEAIGDADMKEEEEDKPTEEEDEEPVKEGEEEDKPTEEEDEELKKDTKESKQGRSNKKLNQLQEQITRMKREGFVRRLCEGSGLPLTKVLLEDFLQLPTRSSIERHVLRLALAHRQTKPKSGARFTEAVSKIPTGNNLYNWLQN